MTDTNALEAFFEYLSFPEYTRYLYDDRAVDKYIRQAEVLFTTMIKEARENRAELNQTGGDIAAYFKGLNKKIDNYRRGTFRSKGTDIFHRSSGLKVGDETVDRYMLLKYIYDSYDSVRDHFEELSAPGTSKPIGNQGSTTSYPSFTVKHDSTAYSLHTGLKKLGYINCDLKAFLDAFTGMEISTRIQWLKANSHLTHLIKRLCSDGLIVNPGDKDRWPLTIKVFTKANDSEFKKEELSNSSSHVRKMGVPILDDLINEIKSKIRK